MAIKVQFYLKLKNHATYVHCAFWVIVVLLVFSICLVLTTHLLLWQRCLDCLWAWTDGYSFAVQTPVWQTLYLLHLYASSYSSSAQGTHIVHRPTTHMHKYTANSASYLSLSSMVICQYPAPKSRAVNHWALVYSSNPMWNLACQ